MEHFILGCRCLEAVRNPVLHELVTKLTECDIDFLQLNETKKIQLILDSTTIGKTRKITSASAQRVELLTRRLIFQLHITSQYVIQLRGRQKWTSLFLNLPRKIPACTCNKPSFYFSEL